MFLVGGFAESPILQFEIRREFEHRLKIVIPQEVSLTILKGKSQTSFACHVHVCKFKHVRCDGPARLLYIGLAVWFWLEIVKCK